MLTKLPNPKPVIFKKFLVSYLFILVIPIILGNFAYNETVKLVEEDARESRLSMLNQTRDVIDKYFKDLDETVIQLSVDPKLNGLLNLDKLEQASPTFYDIWEGYNSIKSRILRSHIFQNSYFIFLKNSDLVLCPDGVMDSKTFYNYVFNYDKLRYPDWYRQLFQDHYLKKIIPARTVHFKGVEDRVITYMTSLPLGYKGAGDCVVSFLIDEDDIKKKLENTRIKNSGWYVIVNQKGEVITGNNEQNFHIPKMIFNSQASVGYLHQNVFGKNLLYIYSRSTHNDWTYITALPVNAVMNRADYVKKIAGFMALLSLLLGIFVSILMADRNSKPFSEIIATLKDFFGNDFGKPNSKSKEDEYDYLQGSIRQLISNNQNMKDALERQAAAVKSVFIDRLFKGEFNDRSGMEALLSYIGLKMKGRLFAVVVIKINRHEYLINGKILEELDVFRILIEEVFNRSLKEHGLVHVLNENELAILFSHDSGERIDFAACISGIIQSVRNEIRERYHITPVFGIGEIYDSLPDVHYSFREARQALSAFSGSADQDQTVIWYSKLKKSFSGYYYPIELEMKLIHFVRLGNKQETENILRHIYHENYVVRILPQPTEEQLLNNIKTTLLRILGEIKYQIPIAGLENKADGLGKTEEEFEEITSLLYKICDTVIKNKKSSSTNLAEKILKYIDTQYTDASLSLCSIATHFNLSESYVSQLFKEKIGEKFSSYLEHLRITKASELILENKGSIDDIAIMTGYNSSHSFRRAFKRTMGRAPSEYIQIMREQSS